MVIWYDFSPGAVFRKPIIQSSTCDAVWRSVMCSSHQDTPQCLPSSPLRHSNNQGRVWLNQIKENNKTPLSLISGSAIINVKEWDYPYHGEHYQSYVSSDHDYVGDWRNWWQFPFNQDSRQVRRQWLLQHSSAFTWFGPDLPIRKLPHDYGTAGPPVQPGGDRLF